MWGHVHVHAVMAREPIMKHPSMNDEEKDRALIQAAVDNPFLDKAAKGREINKVIAAITNNPQLTDEEKIRRWMAALGKGFFIILDPEVRDKIDRILALPEFNTAPTGLKK